MKSVYRIAGLAWAMIVCLCWSSVVSADVVDGYPSILTSKDTRGVYVWRTKSGEWQLRVAAGGSGDAVAIDGAFHSNANISAFSAVVLEADDQLSLADSRTLQFDLSAAAGTRDGLRFSNAGSGACLSSQSGTPVTVFLGKLAVPATTPVDLTGDGACGQTGSVPLPATARKFHPGHYIFMLKKPSTQEAMSESIYPGVKGILKRFTWRELEPTEGNYDFSVVASDLDFVGSLGKQFIVMIEDKTFAGGENPLPDYLKHLAAPNNAGAYTAVRWDPYLVSRLNALTRALGQQFDANPAFEGIALQESSLSLSSETLDRFSYTPEKYRDALIDMLKNAAKNMPHSQVFWYQSYIARNNKYIGEVAAAVKDDGVAMGGPDNMPDSVQLQTHSYPYYEQFKGQMPLFIQVEGVNYRHEHVDTSYPTKYWTMPELFAFGRDYLHVNYFFWVRIPGSEYPDSYNWTHALPVIEKNPVFNQ